MDLFSFSFVPMLLLQASLIHPSYQSDPIASFIRILLAPIIILIAISSQSQKLFLPIHEFLHLNYALIAVPTFHVCCLAIQFAFHRGPVYKQQPDDHKIDHHSSSSKITSSPSVFNLIKFSLAILTSPRGLEYSWAPPQACLSKAPKIPLRSFICRSTIEILWNHTLFIMASIYLLPVSHHPNGPVGWWFENVLGIDHQNHSNDIDRSMKIPKTIMIPIVPTLLNYLTAFVYTFLAIRAFTLLGLILDLFQIFLISLARLLLPKDLRPDPIDTSLYPPMFNRLGSRDTLGDFWGKGWQCVFRRDFVFCGGTPMKKLGTSLFGPKAARAFAVMGSMIFSGIFHEWGILTVSKPDWKFNTTKFFIVQGIGLLIEDTLKINLPSSATSTEHPILRRLKAFSRYLLTYSWLCFTSQGMFEALYERGLGRSGIIEPDFRNWSWFQYLLPFGPFIPRRLLFDPMTDVA